MILDWHAIESVGQIEKPKEIGNTMSSASGHVVELYSNRFLTLPLGNGSKRILRSWGKPHISPKSFEYVLNQRAIGVNRSGGRSRLGAIYATTSFLGMLKQTFTTQATGRHEVA